MNDKRYLRSNEVAALTGVSSAEIREYEKLKLIPASKRSAGKYRLYSRDTVERVQLIRHALEMGFSPEELNKIQSVRNTASPSCRQVRQILENKAHAMREYVEELTAMRDHLRRILMDWDDRLQELPEGKPRLLETLIIPAHLLKTDV